MAAAATTPAAAATIVTAVATLATAEAVAKCQHCGQSTHSIEGCQVNLHCQLCQRHHTGREACQDCRQLPAKLSSTASAAQGGDADAESKAPLGASCGEGNLRTP